METERGSTIGESGKGSTRLKNIRKTCCWLLIVTMLIEIRTVLEILVSSEKTVLAIIFVLMFTW